MMAYQKNINQKLESFMKRNLPSDEYQKIRCYERCIVDKGMKLALLTSKNLIITDSPPRTLHYTLPISDFISVALVQDLPDFLHGNVKLKSQHISIKLKHEIVRQKHKHPDLKKSGSQSSFISESSGETSSETSPNNSVSGTSLNFTLWRDTLSAHRYLKPYLKLDQSLDDSSGRMDRWNSNCRLNVSDSASLSSRSFGSLSQSSLSSSTSSATTDLDLFLLTDSSYFYKLLKSATLNEKIAETKELDFSRSKPKVNKRKKNSSLEMQLYTQLSNEIQATNSLEHSFLLVRELYTAASNNHNIKQYFWKDNELCKELLQQIRQYLLRSQHGNNRADELEYVILLQMCLSELFRESEHLSARMHLLTANSNTLFRTLVECCTLQPFIPPLFRNSTEIEGLCQELTESTAVLLFEIALTVTRHPKYGTELTTSQFVAVLEQHAQSFKCIFKEIVEKCLCLLSRTLSAHQTLIIYQIFYLIDVLSRHNAVFGRLLVAKYSDDIKYYCKQPESKIVRWSPLQSLAIDKIRSVQEFVCSANSVLRQSPKPFTP